MKMLSLILMIPVSVLVHGLVVSTLWGWFVVPTFGLPDIGILTAAGLSMVFNYGSTSSSKALETTEEIVQFAINRLALVPSMALLIGWIITKLA